MELRQHTTQIEQDTKTGVQTTSLNYTSLNTEEYCGTIMWFEERVKKTSNKTRVNFSLCCSEGKLRLSKLQEPPEFLKSLLDFGTPGRGAKFRQLIRMYNSCYQFTSMGAKIDNSCYQFLKCKLF
ncbi:hypothetical protein RND81_01G089200 [Saponaria officinalis]|uniref:Uncharacterized protein n=1 Tax=Saponaria officinalis TaxID=3572 RepID=A0AAW1NCX7_SAPOF